MEDMAEETDFQLEEDTDLEPDDDSIYIAAPLWPNSLLPLPIRAPIVPSIPRSRPHECCICDNTSQSRRCIVCNHARCSECRVFTIESDIIDNMNAGLGFAERPVLESVEGAPVVETSIKEEELHVNFADLPIRQTSISRSGPSNSGPSTTTKRKVWFATSGSSMPTRRKLHDSATPITRSAMKRKASTPPSPIPYTPKAQKDQIPVSANTRSAKKRIVSASEDEVSSPIQFTPKGRRDQVPVDSNSKSAKKEDSSALERTPSIDALRKQGDQIDHSPTSRRTRKRKTLTPALEESFRMSMSLRGSNVEDGTGRGRSKRTRY